MNLEVKSILTYKKAAGVWARCSFFGVALCLSSSLLGAELTFPSLVVGSQTYSNVTVTSKTPRYVIISHARGMASLKLKDLSEDVLTQLGYKVTPSVAKTQSFLPGKIALDPRLKEMGEKGVKQIKEQFQELDPMLLEGTLAGLVLLYFLLSYCGMLICQKAGHSPGGLIWVPVLQIVPLLKAAGMSAWWILLWLVPGINIVAIAFWCAKICKGRGKSAWLGIFLFLPATNLFTFLYLAFADGEEEEQRPLKITFG